MYNYVSERGTKFQPILSDNSSTTGSAYNKFTIDINAFNVTSSREVTAEQIINNSTEIYEIDSNETEDSSPQALEFRRKRGKTNRRYENAPRPFLYENRDPRPTGFQATTGQQTAQTQNVPINTNKVKNIQEIIQLLSNQNDDQVSETNTKRVKSKNRKYKPQSKKTYNNPSFVSDPFFPYKPQNPSDINLLATNSFRFAPSVQIEIKRPPVIPTETYPKYERPNQYQLFHLHQAQLSPKDVLNQNQPISVTLPLDLSNKRTKMRKPSNFNLYNQNQYFTQPNRFQQNLQQTRSQPYFRPWNWNLIPARNTNNQMRNNNLYANHQYQQGIVKGGQSPMIVHLNLYPKKKKNHQQGDSETDESTIHSLHNCTTSDDQITYFDNSDIDNLNIPQIKNATEFNQLLEHVSSGHNNPLEDQTYNDKDTTSDNQNLFRIKNTFFQRDKPDLHEDLSENFRIQDNDYLANQKPNVEIQKSIGFTILNKTFTNSDYITSENKWRPITFDGKYFLNTDEINVSNERDDKITTIANESANKNEHYGLEVGEVNESFEEKESVTLPIPPDIFQKYFNTKPTPKYNNEWDPAIIERNPNLINHRATFQDRNE